MKIKKAEHEVVKASNNVFIRNTSHPDVKTPSCLPDVLQMTWCQTASIVSDVIQLSSAYFRFARLCSRLFSSATRASPTSSIDPSRGTDQSKKHLSSK